MPNHQARRNPLPADYQHPTHGVDCDCVTCRNRWVMPESAQPLALPRDVFALVSAGLGQPVRRWDVLFGVAHVEEPTADTPWAV